MKWKQRAAAWKQAQQARRQTASTPAPAPVETADEIEVMEDAAEALEAEEKATKKRRWSRKKKED